MKVLIVDASNKKLVAKIPISFGLANTQTTEKDVFDEAWKTAIEDGLVEKNKRENYRFSIEE